MVSAFLLCATFEMMGFWDGFGAYLYSRRLMPCGRGLMAPPGLTALGAKGSACDRLRLTGRLRAPPRVVMKHRCAGEVRRPWGRQYKCRLWRRKPLQPPCGRGNAFLLWWLAPPPCPVGSMSLDSRVAGLPYESSSFATPASGGSPAKPDRGKRAQRANQQNAYHAI